MTQAERLNGLLKKLFPDNDEKIDAGDWDGMGLKGAPYSFDTNVKGQRRLRIANHETGETIGIVGGTVEEVLDALEARLERS